MRRLLAVPLTIALLVGVATPVYADAESNASDVIVRLTNNIREGEGKSELAVKSGLTGVADRWSEKQLVRVVAAWEKYLAGGTLSVPLEHNPNYSSQIPSGWTSAGENVGWACGYSSAKEAAKAIERAWKNSPAHLENILGGYTHIGVGFAFDTETGCAFSTQNFGKYAKSSAVLAASTSRFSDVTKKTAGYSAIMWLADEGLVSGYKDGTFRPGTKVTRRQLAGIMYKLAGSPSVSLPSKSPFSDLKKSDPAYRAIVWLESTDLVSGYKDGTFRPGSKVTRRQLAGILYKFAGSPSVSLPSKSPYSDLKKSDPGYRAIVWLESTDLVSGYKDGTYRAGLKVTRRQLAGVLYRYAG
ncbi:S-layer homology domain-containing protein [Demequina salsinemoris]|uniref:CAP and S-layer homology domain-containing protein n=1 Tax=Demequina salsinemoris TaxID=577470 RepID=UPI0007811838|nr:S-layer homology domain-containing protein [Demequina salsinemoris]